MDSAADPKVYFTVPSLWKSKSVQRLWNPLPNQMVAADWLKGAEYDNESPVWISWRSDEQIWKLTYVQSGGSCCLDKYVQIDMENKLNSKQDLW